MVVCGILAERAAHGMNHHRQGVLRVFCRGVAKYDLQVVEWFYIKRIMLYLLKQQI